MMRRTLLSGLIMLLLSSNLAIAQEETSNSKVSVDYSVDFVSRYLWRGLLFNGNPNIQPTISLTAGGFSFGSWASYGVSQNYAEVDIFVTYTAGSFSATLFDYFNEDTIQIKTYDYFHWDRKTTGHALEGTLAWAGTESFPLNVTAAVFFYGNDRKNNSTKDQRYSSYLELGYPVNVGDYKLNLFIGGTLNEGLYHADPNIVNVGFKTTKEIEITEKFKLPVSATFVVNPAKEDVFFVVGITL